VRAERPQILKAPPPVCAGRGSSTGPANGCDSRGRGRRLGQRDAAHFRPVDILVNNAGIGIFGPFQEQTEAEWNAVLDTNLKSVFLASRAVGARNDRRKAGHIINIVSLAGKSTFATGAIYCASKWGLLGLSGCMAEDLRAHGIRVSAICPGSVATEFSRTPAKIRPGCCNRKTWRTPWQRS